MKHYIITRFNIKSEVWRTAKDGSMLMTDEWMKNRWQLFDNYCLPSVRNQSDQDFIWLVCFDTETSDKDRERIKLLEQEVPQFRALFMTGFKEMLPTIKQSIVDTADNDNQIITTRLDNDDALHSEFIQTVKNLAKDQRKAIIDLRKGYQMTLNDDQNVLRMVSEKFNPFISLVESVDSFETVVSRMHREWKNQAPVVIYSKKPMWIQILHDKNIMNSVNFSYPVTNKLDGIFGFQTDIKIHGVFSLIISSINSRLFQLMNLAKKLVKLIIGRP